MIEISIILSTLLLFSNPIEKNDLSEYKIPNIQIQVQDQVYISCNNFKVINIVSESTGYSVIIEDEQKNEYVLAGLHEVYVKKNCDYINGQKIGRDYSLDNFTKFVLIVYNDVNRFPQFNNNKMYITVENGNKIYAMSNGIVKLVEYSIDKGNLISIEDEKDNINIEYWHIMSFRVLRGYSAKQNEVIAFVGNTGVSLEPHLGILFHPNNNYESFKAIYIKNK